LASTAGSGAVAANTASRASRRALTAFWAVAGTGWWPVILVAAIATFFRVWHIAGVPPGLFGDEAVDGLDAMDVLAGRGAVFFPANFGREGLHIWLVAGMFRWLGVSALAVRLPSVIAGILTALVTYWLGVELVRSVPDARLKALRLPFGLSAATFTGLFAALYLSTSYFHVHYSRFGIRGVFTPLCGAIAFAAFWHGTNTGRRYFWYAVSGFFLGLSLHFYTASRFYPILLAVFLLVQTGICLARRRRQDAILLRDIGPLFGLVLMAFVVFAPLGLYFWQHPGSFGQRASEVSAFRAGSPWLRVGQAAVANVLQFFVPGRGDTAQFYNLPGRAVFDPITAFLAVLGIAALIVAIRYPSALFLLLWWPILMLPSFLATDRFPTLPRVIGTIPGIYYFPAVGLLAVLAGARNWLDRGLEHGMGQRTRSAVSAGLAILAVLAILVPAAISYRDYFLVWGRSPETNDAFELDMAQAASWLNANAPASHVYLSSDIYRHPTLMLLHEQATVIGYLEKPDPRLSWYDGRSALPLPPSGQPATYVVGAGARPPALTSDSPLALAMQPLQLHPGPQPSMATIWDLPENISGVPGGTLGAGPAREFTDKLALIGASWGNDGGPRPMLWLYWETAGPDPAGWPGYRLQVAGRNSDGTEWQYEVPFDDFRPPEWVPGGRFLTWRQVQVPGGTQPLPAALRLRLIKADSLEPVTGPDAPDGWHVVPVEYGR
jgi:4-amino-4-deoxy-L-arabinose transferase-like glycosyltransferase